MRAMARYSDTGREGFRHARNERRMRAMALLLAGVLALTTLLSAVVIARLHGHDCAGDDCAVCRVLDAARVSLTMGAVAGALTGLSLGLQLLAAGTTPLVCMALAAQTPVSLKVKLVI